MATLAHAVSETGSIPDAVDAYKLTVAAAYTSVKDLLDAKYHYEIAWCETSGSPTAEQPHPIISRFSRSLPAEAWLVASPLGIDGKKMPGVDRIVCPISFDAITHEDRKEVEDILYAELAELTSRETDSRVARTLPKVAA